jgi:hypothetical protein
MCGVDRLDSISTRNIARLKGIAQRRNGTAGIGTA